MAEQAAKRNLTYELAGVGFVILLVVFVILYSYANTIQGKYTGLSANYSSLSKNYSALSHEFNATSLNLLRFEANYTPLLIDYNEESYNLSHRYTKTLFTNFTTIVGSISLNHTFTYYAAGGFYNYTFNAPYSGYFVFNATGTPPNSRIWTNWEVYFSQQAPIWVKGQPGFNTTSASVSVITPLKGTTYFVPVSKGINYMLIYNLNGSTPLRVVGMNLKYFGYYSSN